MPANNENVLELTLHNTVNMLNAVVLCALRCFNIMLHIMPNGRQILVPGDGCCFFSDCRYFANEPFADFHRVEGLQGVYIATLINGSMNEENMRSVITFDKGGTWEFLQAPAFTGYGEKINCEVQLL